MGGTNTDAVILDRGDRVLAKAKVPSTPEPAAGIEDAIAAVLGRLDLDPGRITHVMVGTTQVVNVVLERRNLLKVGVIRIGSPATHAVRPLFGWPADLRSAVSVAATIVGGGIEFDGRDLAPLDADAICRFCEQIAPVAGGIAITCVFAPVSSRHELTAEQIVHRELGDINVSLSHRIGSVGLIERENATVLNATLLGVAREVVRATETSLGARGLDAVTYFAQNDGTLMSIEHALHYPVLTIGSGPANSMRGAAFLSGAADALVADVGGTSTEVGILVHGFPRESSNGIEVGGIRTNFRMPDLVTIALGGGSHVTTGNDGIVLVGPRSVGHRLQHEAMVFGGSTATLTDAAVSVGRVSLGDPRPLERHGAVLAAAVGRADAMWADAVDRIKTSAEPRPLIAVGGGAVLMPGTIPGVSEVVSPRHSEAANAIGAAIASVGGEVDRIFHLGAGGREGALTEATEEAAREAVGAGADPATVEVVELDEIPLAYLTMPAVRIRAKAVGSIAGL